MFNVLVLAVGAFCYGVSAHLAHEMRYKKCSVLCAVAFVVEVAGLVLTVIFR